MNILEFANPQGWWWAALALPVIGFYILKVRLRRQPVSTLLFWDRVFDEKKPRAWWQQLRHWLSLLLQLALLFLLVGAVVDPLWSWQKNQRRKLVLVVDNSASMAADEMGQTRLQLAKETAAALIRSLRVGDEMAVLTAGGKSAVAIGLTSHGRSLLEALDQIPQTDAPAALPSAVATAKRLISDSEQSQIIVLTDGCDPTTGDLQQDPRVLLYGFGSTQDNLAITQYQVRRSLLDAIGYQVLVEVSNLSDHSRNCRLELTLDDDLVDVVPLELEPGESKTLNLDQSSAMGGRLVAQLDQQDGLALDNRALAVLPTRRRLPVILVTPGSLFLKSVFESIPLVELTVLKTLPADWTTRPDQIVVLHQAVPAQLPVGKLLVIGPRKDCELWSVGDLLDSPLVGSVDETSSIMQHVRLSNVLFPGARDLTFVGDSISLVKTAYDEPLLSQLRRPQGDALVLNLNLDQGDLPLRIAFPVLMKNIVEWFQGPQSELLPALATGQSTVIRLPAVAASMRPATTTNPLFPEAAGEQGSPKMEVVTAEHGNANLASFLLRSPSGKLTPLARTESMATIASLTECGLWTIGTSAALQADPWISEKMDQDAAPKSLQAKEEQDDEVIHFASNLCNLDESDLTPRVTLQSPSDFGMLSLGGRSIWFYLVLGGLILASVEWWLYQRRMVG